MKKVIGLSGVLAILFSQAGCVGNNTPKQEDSLPFPYATQEIKQQLAEQLLGEKEPISADYFEKINYTPLMEQMMHAGPSVFGEKEEQQVFWYYLMRLRMLTLYYTYPRAIDDWGILVEQLNALGEPARTFIEQHPQEGQALFASVIAYEEKYPYNPQKGIDEQRAKLKGMLEAASAQTSPEKKEEEKPQQATTPGMFSWSNESTGEKITLAYEELENLTRQEFKDKFNDTFGDLTDLSDEKFKQVKQFLIESDKLFSQDLGPGDFIEKARDIDERYKDLKGIVKMNLDIKLSLEATRQFTDEDRNQLQYELDSLENVPEQFPAVRQQILQAFKNDLEQMQSGLSPEEYAAKKKAERGITEYAIYLQAPQLFPAEPIFAEFVLDPQNDEARYSFRKLFFSNSGVGGTRIEDEKPLPYKVDMMWYSITENKIYSLQADLPYGAIKEKFFPQKEDSSLGLLMMVAPHGQARLYVYDTITQEKQLLASFQAQEKQLSLDQFRQAGPLYENADNLAANWTDYQQKALSQFPQAKKFLAEEGLPNKEFDFWSDRDIEEAGQAPLARAVRANKDALVTKLLAQNVDVNAIDPHTGETALSAACSMGHTTYVEQLIQAKANVNLPEGQSGRTPLMEAVMSGNTEIVKMLLDAGADVNAPEVLYGQETGHNALKYAQENHHDDIVKLLLEKGAKEPAATPTTNVTAAVSLDQALMMGDIAQVKTLLAQGEDPNTQIPGVGPALLFACTGGNVEVARALIEAKADVNAASNTSGFTPLMMAAQTGNKQLVEMLIKAGADVNIPHQLNGQASGLNALKMAQNGGFTDIVALLKAAGAKE